MARLRPWQREIALLAMLYLLYTSSRLIPLAPAGADVRNGHRVLNLEHALHIAPERALNDWLFDAPRWLSVGAAYYYQSLHYLLTGVTLIWLYRTGAAGYRQARTWLATMTFSALIVFWSFPVSPPRTLPGGVLHDTIAEQHQYGWWGAGGGPAPSGLAGLVNDNAAMPSLHVGWAVWVGWNLWRSSRNPFVRAFGFAYPLLTAAVVISTGNHYLLDVLAGALLAWLSKLAVDRVLRHLRTRRPLDRRQAPTIAACPRTPKDRTPKDRTPKRRPPNHRPPNHRTASRPCARRPS